MCGRFNVDAHPLSQLLLEVVQLRHPGPDNHNAAPTETIVVLRTGAAGEPELAPMRWWLTPYWAPEATTKYSMFNAKSETVEKSRAFREPFERRRCAVPVSGFYEWARGEGRKLPYYIRPHDAPGLWLAGLWDRWRDRVNDTVLESFAVLTTRAHPAIEHIHSRQPVLLGSPAVARWLDPGVPGDAVKPLLEPAVPVAVDLVPVSTYVNDARHKARRCIEPVGEARTVAADPAP
ncbi:MAG: SOS response-associated peptidase [Pseudomonadota bacterium]